MPNIPDPLSPGHVLHVPGTSDGHASLSVPCPDSAHAHAFLGQDGNLAVPGGRYGTDTESCIPVAIALARTYCFQCGTEVTYGDLDWAMSEVVNSTDGVSSLLRAYGEEAGIDVRDILDESEFYAGHEDEEEDERTLHYSVCVDGAPVEDFEDGVDALERAEEIRRIGYAPNGGGSMADYHDPDVVTVLVWTDQDE
ncbi:MAG TPA: hypothetical protein VJP59_07960 [Gemmatimonadota bacterium]|nr:hypothetical protein [Gemmatimonadota bacterium]